MVKTKVKKNKNIESENLPAVISTREVANYSPPTVRTPKAKDPLEIYLKEISRYELLSPEQEYALTKALQETGDIEIAKQLVTANLRLVVKIAMEYRFAHQNVIDLIQEGNIGLMKAVSKYTPDKGTKLSYYASWWIRSYILKFILDNFRLVKVSTTNEQKKLFYNLLKERDRLVQMGISPDSKAIAESLDVSEKAVTIMSERLLTGGESSLDAPLSEGSSDSFGDFLSNNDVPLEDQLAEKQELKILEDQLSTFVGSLKERDREIFNKRLLNEVPLSLQAIADEYGITRERVRQIEERLLEKLKVYMSPFLS